MRAYEAAYAYFRDALIGPVLEEELTTDPILTFSRTRRQGALAFFAADAWRSHGGEARLCELALVPEHTADDPRDVMSSLVHELMHFVDHAAGTAPKTPGYHGRTWFRRMERVGLPGRALSKSRIAVTHDVDENGPFARAFAAMPEEVLLPFIAALADVDDEDEPAERETKKGKRFRYWCPGCATTMRGPSGRSLYCAIAGLLISRTERRRMTRTLPTPPPKLLTCETASLRRARRARRRPAGTRDRRGAQLRAPALSTGRAAVGALLPTVCGRGNPALAGRTARRDQRTPARSRRATRRGGAAPGFGPRPAGGVRPARPRHAGALRGLRHPR